MKFELELNRRDITKEQILADIACVAAKLGLNSLTILQYNKYGRYGSSLVRQRCGSWLQATAEAGLSIKRKNSKASPDEFIPDLKRVANVLGKSSVTQTEYQNHGRCGPGVVSRHFGGWLEALRAAGLEKTREYRVSDEEYFQNLETIWVHLSRQPRYGEVRKPFSRYSAGAYERRFGSWRKALEAFAEYVNTEPSPLVKTEEARRSAGIAQYTFKDNHKTKRSISERLKVRVLIRDGNKCRLCGITVNGDNIHFDHIKPWSKGGETTFENIQVLCAKHNLAKGDFYEEI